MGAEALRLFGTSGNSGLPAACSLLPVAISLDALTPYFTNLNLSITVLSLNSFDNALTNSNGTS